jgi:hypothetical protein
MRAENWTRQELELEGWPVTLTSYRIADSYLTEIESTDSGASIARGIAATSEQSRKEAFETAIKRLIRTRRIADMTVGG